MTNHPSLLPLPEYLTERRSDLVNQVYAVSGILQKALTEGKLSDDDEDRLIEATDTLQSSCYDWASAMKGEARRIPE